MMHHTWQRLDHLFEQALTLPPDERQTFLADVERQHPDLYPRLCSLLESDQATTGFLDDHAPDLVATLLSDAPAPEDQPISGMIGPYTIVRELGQGGMGIVYLAQRTHDGFAQSVALKVLKRGLDTHAVIQRFRQERAVLAALEHPNIARILDAGTTPDGRPYFAMEYIDGQPITAYCDERHVRIEERLALFETVCEAVQYAHQNLVVHRDLKPSNILVTADGTVKLLDFGIAKVLGERPHSFSLIETVPAERLLTPAYASPEQLRGEVISTASDVYALGVLLYELLVGLRPSQPLLRQAVEHVLAHHEIVRPSKAVTALLRTKEAEDETTWLVEARQTSYDRLRRQLEGDLDVICLKALHQDVDRRYGTAGALGADIRRHLGGMPVEAQPDRYSYRLRKFVGRHRGAVFSVTSVIVLFLGFLAFHNARITTERDRALQEAQKAEEVKTFMVNLFTVSSPYSVAGDSLLARTVLDTAAARIRAELTNQPEVQADLLATLGIVYSDLGLFSTSDTLLQQALVQQRRLLGHVHPDITRTLQHLGINAYFMEDGPAMLHYLGEALAITETLYGPLHEATLEDQGDYAIALEAVGNYTAAESLYLAVLANVRQHYGEDHSEYTRNQANLADLYRQLEAYDKALLLAQKALTRERQALGPDHPHVGASMLNIATLLMETGDFAAADSMFKQTAAFFEAFYDEPHPQTGTAFTEWGFLALKQKAHAAAERRLRQGLSLLQASLPPTHEAVVEAQAALGALYLYQNRPAEARPLLEYTESFFAPTSERDLSEQADMRDWLVDLHLTLGNTAEAERLQALPHLPPIDEKWRSR